MESDKPLKPAQFIRRMKMLPKLEDATPGQAYEILDSFRQSYAMTKHQMKAMNLTARDQQAGFALITGMVTHASTGLGELVVALHHRALGEDTDTDKKRLQAGWQTIYDAQTSAHPVEKIMAPFPAACLQKAILEVLPPPQKQQSGGRNIGGEQKQIGE